MNDLKKIIKQKIIRNENSGNSQLNHIPKKQTNKHKNKIVCFGENIRTVARQGFAEEIKCGTYESKQQIQQKHCKVVVKRREMGQN